MEPLSISVPQEELKDDYKSSDDNKSSDDSLYNDDNLYELCEDVLDEKKMLEYAIQKKRMILYGHSALIFFPWIIVIGVVIYKKKNKKDGKIKHTDVKVKTLCCSLLLILICTLSVFTPSLMYIAALIRNMTVAQLWLGAIESFPIADYRGLDNY